MKRYRLRKGRKQALFGIAESAATLTAAGINAASALSAAGIQAAATRDAAKQQAEAAQQAAQQQADAIQTINENNTKLQTKSINATKAENEKFRNAQQDIQTTLQMMIGRENENDRLDAARIQVKNGGGKRKLRDIINPSLLRGSYQNLPFTVTDGGAVIPIGTTQEGYDLYEIIGNDHEHYHKTKNGKHKSGVGIKFLGRETIEGEGNQNTNQGELMLVTPNDAKFISKHSIKGFNPTKAVLSGMDPIDAFNYQEMIKNVYGISDDGKDNNRTPVERIRELKCGGRSKRDRGGSSIYDINPNKNIARGFLFNDFNNSIKHINWKGIPYHLHNIDLKNSNIISNNNNNNNNKEVNVKTKQSDLSKTNLIGSGITAAANLIGAGISNIANNRATKRLNDAYNQAGQTIANAYSNLKTIDPNLIKRSDFKAPHAMAAIRSANVNINPELAAIERATQRRLSGIKRNSLSGAAAINRASNAEIDAYDMRSRIYGQAHNQAETIRQANADRLTQTSQFNAQQDAQANQSYLAAKLNLAQYNNEIENERITGAAQARADALTRTAENTAATRQANTTGWTSAITNGIGGIGNTLSANAKSQADFDNVWLGASLEDKVQYLVNNPSDPRKQSVIDILKASNNEQYKKWLDLLNK